MSKILTNIVDILAISHLNEKETKDLASLLAKYFLFFSLLEIWNLKFEMCSIFSLGILIHLEICVRALEGRRHAMRQQEEGNIAEDEADSDWDDWNNHWIVKTEDHNLSFQNILFETDILFVIESDCVCLLLKLLFFGQTDVLVVLLICLFFEHNGMFGDS